MTFVHFCVFYVSNKIKNGQNFCAAPALPAAKPCAATAPHALVIPLGNRPLYGTLYGAMKLFRKFVFVIKYK